MVRTGTWKNGKEEWSKGRITRRRGGRGQATSTEPFGRLKDGGRGDGTLRTRGRSQGTLQPKARVKKRLATKKEHPPKEGVRTHSTLKDRGLQPKKWFSGKSTQRGEKVVLPKGAGAHENLRDHNGRCGKQSCHENVNLLHKKRHPGVEASQEGQEKAVVEKPGGRSMLLKLKGFCRK